MAPWPHGLTLSDGQETPEVGKDWLWKAAHHLQLHGLRRELGMAIDGVIRLPFG